MYLFSQHRAPGHYLDVVDVLGLVGDDGGLGLAVLGGDSWPAGRCGCSDRTGLNKKVQLMDK